MDTDLVKSILSVIAASIPLIVAIIALIRSRAYGIAVPNDSPSLKVLKIKSEPVDQKAWKQYRFGQIMAGILWTIPGYIIYTFVIFYTSGQIKNSFVIVIITCTFGVAYIFVSFLISRMLFLDYLFAIKNAYSGRYLLFKSIYVEVEADYYYLFNKCHEAFKRLSYPVVEIDADSGVLEAVFTSYRYNNSNDAGLIRVNIKRKNEKGNTYVVGIDVEIFGTRHIVDISKSFSKIANRFVNLLISKPKDSDQKVESKVAVN